MRSRWGATATRAATCWRSGSPSCVQRRTRTLHMHSMHSMHSVHPRAVRRAEWWTLSVALRSDEAARGEVAEQRIHGGRRLGFVHLERVEELADGAVAPLPSLERAEDDRGALVQPVVTLRREIEQDGFVAEVCGEDFGRDLHVM